MQVAQGYSNAESARGLMVFGACGALSFYGLIRANGVFKLAPDQLAVAQAAFSLVCATWAYAISGPLRAAMLTMTVVVIVFCMFALRPRQTLMLSAAAIAGMGTTMWWLQGHDPARFPPMTELLTFGYLAGALVSTALLSGEMSKLRARTKRQKRELSDALDTIKVLATVDELTSLINRRHMNEVLEGEERRHAAGADTCIALLDIDFFKQVNDRYGHATGDAVLQRMAERVHAMEVPGVEGRRITFSAGLASRRAGEPFADTISRADKALYQAKEAGRDRIVLALPDAASVAAPERRYGSR